MRQVAETAEQYDVDHPKPMRVRFEYSPTTAALAAAVRAAIAEIDVAAVAVYTTRGGTPSVLAQHRLATPILALASSARVVRQMALLFGVHPALMDAPTDPGEVLHEAARHLERMGLARKGQKIVIAVGLPFGSPEGTNTMVVRTLE